MKIYTLVILRRTDLSTILLRRTVLLPSWLGNLYFVIFGISPPDHLWSLRPAKV